MPKRQKAYNIIYKATEHNTRLLNFGHNRYTVFGGVYVRTISGEFRPITSSGAPIVVFGNCIRFLTKRHFSPSFWSFAPK